MTLPVLGASADEAAGKLRAAIEARDPGAQVVAPEGSPVAGMYLTSIDGVSGYVSADGRYFIVGDMLDLASRTNVTEWRRKEMRRALLQKVAPDEAIVFAPAKIKYTIIVFTDADCPYCRKFHGELGELQARGVAVRYMAFPRSGPNTKSWRTMAAVWCSSDRRDALTRGPPMTTSQHISQRNLGLFNVEQAPLLDDLTTAYLGLGKTVEARDTQIERLDNAIRRFGTADPRVIPYRYTLARYYEQSRLPESAREQYEEVLKAEESRLGVDDAGLLAPLRELAAIDLLVAQGVDPAQRDRLATLLEQNEGASPLERGLSFALLGDWATVTGDATAARDYYQQAWRTLQTNPEVDVAAFFRKPMMVDFIPPLSPVDRAERTRPYTWAEIVLEFDVSAEGLPSEVRVVTRDPQTTALQSRYSRRLRETHFRPRLVDGEPVATTNVRSTHYVRRYVDKDEEQEAD